MQGMIAKRIGAISPSATLDITAKAKALKNKGFDVTNFAAGEPDFDTPDYIKKAAIKAIENGLTKYTPAAGTKELREAVCEKFKVDNNLTYKAEQVVISCGAKHSLYNLFQAICDKGDEVILPSPYWLSYPEMIRLAEAQPVIVDTNKNTFKVTPELFEKRITKRTKAIVINSPCNPSGAVYYEEELEKLAEVAVKHKIFVVSDEIYEKLIYDNLKHVSIASFGKDIYELTFVVNGVSKSYSMTGWRIGYLAGREEIMRGVAALQSHSTSNPTSISQAAALTAIREKDESVVYMAKEFEKRRNVMVAKLSKIRKIGFGRPQGAFYCFIDVSKTGMDGLTFSNRLLDERYVATISGEPFGFKDYVRLSFATNTNDIEKGIQRIKEFIG